MQIHRSIYILKETMVKYLQLTHSPHSPRVKTYQ